MHAQEATPIHHLSRASDSDRGVSIYVGYHCSSSAIKILEAEGVDDEEKTGACARVCALVCARSCVCRMRLCLCLCSCLCM